MRAGRRSRIVMAVATCLLSVPLTVWVVSRSHSGSVHFSAAGEDVHVGVTPPLALAEWPQALPTDTPSEPAAVGPDSTEEDGAPPLVLPVGRLAALPPSLVAARPAEIPQAAPSSTDDVEPPQESIAAELEIRARGYLQRLDGMEDGAGSPMERVAALFTFLEQQQCAGGSCQAAQWATEAYLRARAELLRAMLEAFLASDGAYDGASEHQALQALHADYTAEMAALAGHVPMLALLPDVLASTLSVPDYLEAPEDDPRALK